MRKAITVVVAVALAGVLAAVVFAGTVNGTAKNDTLRGSGKADSIYGRAGNNKLYGLGGNDKLIGGPGNDLLVGGAGADSLDCGPGTDSAQADDLDKVSPSCESVKGVTPPAISISDASVVEGNSGTATLSFTVVLSKAANKPTSVSYATADGTATAPADYASAGSTLVFNVGEGPRRSPFLLLASSYMSPTRRSRSRCPAPLLGRSPTAPPLARSETTTRLQSRGTTRGKRRRTRHSTSMSPRPGQRSQVLGQVKSTSHALRPHTSRVAGSTSARTPTRSRLMQASRLT